MFRSLRWKFTAWYVGASIFVLAAVGITVFLLESRALSHRLEGSIRAGGDAVKAATATSMRRPGATPALEDAAHAIDTLVDYPWLSANDVFVILLDTDGRVVANPKNLAPAVISDADAIDRALLNGEDWRTVRLDDLKLRVKTFPLLDAAGGVIGFVQAGKSMEDMDAALRTLLLIMAGSGLAGVLLFAVGGYVVAGRAIRPVQQSYEQQRRFVSDASHELRTPLTVIRTSAGGLARRGEGGDAVEDIEVEAAYMGRLLENLLLLASADRGRLALEAAPVDLSDFVPAAGHAAGGLAAGTGVSINISAVEALIVLADAERLRQALLNLLDNALKYTPAGGSVTLAAHRDGREAVIEVRDTGVGMSRADLERATDRFFRANRARSRAAGGAGLGLSITKDLLTALGGRLELESEEGAGTTARIRLPLAPASDAAPFQAERPSALPS